MSHLQSDFWKELYESREDGLKIVDAYFGSGGGVGADAYADWHPLLRDFYGGARLMRNLEMELAGP